MSDGPRNLTVLTHSFPTRRPSDLRPSDVFSTPGLILEVDLARQFNDLDGDGVLDGGDPAGGGILTPLVVRNNPGTAGPDANYLRYTGDEHVVLGGTAGNDILIASEGDDTRSEEHTSELQSLMRKLVCRLLLEKKNINTTSSEQLY